MLVSSLKIALKISVTTTTNKRGQAQQHFIFMHHIYGRNSQKAPSLLPLLFILKLFWFCLPLTLIELLSFFCFPFCTVTMLDAAVDVPGASAVDISSVTATVTRLDAAVDVAAASAVVVDAFYASAL